MRITLRAALAAHTLAACYRHTWGEVISPADIERLADHNGLVDPDHIRALSRERIGADPLPGILGPELDEAGQIVHTTATGRLRWAISPVDEEITFFVYRPTGGAVLWARLRLDNYDLLGADGYGTSCRRHLDALVAAVGALSLDAARRVEKDLVPCIDPHDRVRWDRLGICDDPQAPPIASESVNPALFREALVAFRETGELPGGYTWASTGLPHEDPGAPSTWGPRSPGDIEWTGFDEALEEAYGRG